MSYVDDILDSKAAFEKWWDARCKEGDPSRMPNPTFRAFMDGYKAGKQSTRAAEEAV